MSTLRVSELLIATSNGGKLREFRDLLSSPALELRSLSDFPQVEDVVETGVTFAANAELKASGYALQTNLWTLADDSGLEVYALGGAPGLFSARHAGQAATSRQRNQKVLAELHDAKETERGARFVCVLALAATDGEVVHTETGICQGRIASEARGTNGFGYDSIFIPDGFSHTFGELSNDIKRQISHRARASSQMAQSLYRFLESSP